MHRFSCCTWRRHLTPNNTVRNVAAMYIKLFLHKISINNFYQYWRTSMSCDGTFELTFLKTHDIIFFYKHNKNMYSVFMYLMDKTPKKCVTWTLNLLAADVPHKYAHNCTESEWWHKKNRLLSFVKFIQSISDYFSYLVVLKNSLWMSEKNARM